MKQILRLAVLASILFLSNSLLAQKQSADNHKDLVKWMTLTEALEKQKEYPKKIFVDVYTDWCGWCKVMSKNTFSDAQIAGYINQYFYPVRFNAETTDTIEYLGKSYVNKNIGGRRPTHELAFVLTKNRPSYPTISYLDERGQLIQALPGYIDVQKIQPFLIYFNENAFRSAPFESFKKNFDKTFINPEKPKQNYIQWVTFEDAQKMAKSSPKPILIDIYANFSYTSKVMEATTFTQDSLIDYVNKYFYAVKFDPTQKDTIVFNGKAFANRGGAYGFHDLAIHLTNRQIGIPAVIFLNDKLELLSNVPGYRSGRELEPILEYFGEGKYLTQKWEQYIQTFKSHFYPPEPKTK